MSPPTRKDALRNRDHILTIARESIDAGGQIQLNDIAKSAGLGVATVYRHFPTPDALMSALADERLEALLAHHLDCSDAWNALVQFLETGLTAQLQDPALAAVLTASSPHESRKRLTDRLDDVLTSAQNARSASAEITASDLLALMCGIVVAARSHGDAEDSATIEIGHRYLHIMLRGLQAPDASAIR